MLNVTVQFIKKASNFCNFLNNKLEKKGSDINIYFMIPAEIN